MPVVREKFVGLSVQGDGCPLCAKNLWDDSSDGVHRAKPAVEVRGYS